MTRMQADAGRIGPVTDLLVAELRSAPTVPPRVLDCGGGSGGYAVPLALSGCDVTVIDISADALATLQRRAAEAGVSGSVHAVVGDVEVLGGAEPNTGAVPAGGADADSSAGRAEPDTGADPASGTDADSAAGRAEPNTGAVPAGGAAADLAAGTGSASGVELTGGFDAALAHGILHAVEDVAATFAGIVAAVRPGGLVSIVVANPVAAVLARALAGEPELALRELRELDEPGARLGPEAVERLCAQHGLQVVFRRGLAVFSDLVPGAAADAPGAREALRVLDATAADRAPFAQLAGRVHLLARTPGG